MSRPALSALRALEIIDLMAGQPAEKFTLSDIVRLTGTNASSCHAILNVLLQRGYLLRDPERKTYRLAPSIVAIGEAAAAHDPLLERAREAARVQAEETGFETLLTARAGSDIIAVARYAGENAAAINLRVGQRVPLVAPLGGLFFAWAEEEEAREWCAADGANTPEETVRDHRQALALLRQRGFLVSLRSAEHGAFTRQLKAEEAAVQPRLAMLLRAMDNGLYQPDAIDLEADYRVQVLSAPIFDRFGRVIYNIGISFPEHAVTGRVLLERAERLSEACAVAGAGAMPLHAQEA